MDVNETGLQVRECSTPGYVTYNRGDAKCYKYYSEQVTQSEALAQCKKDNATLITAKHPEQVTIIKALAGNEVSNIWLGMVRISDGSSDASFMWLDGSAVSYSYWIATEPDDNLDCVMAHPRHSYRWNDQGTHIHLYSRWETGGMGWLYALPRSRQLLYTDNTTHTDCKKMTH